MKDFIIQKGWDIRLSRVVAELYDQAFGHKFSVAIGNQQQRISVLSHGLMPEYSYCVLVEEEIIGLAGFQTQKGSLTGAITLSILIHHLGYLKGIWAEAILSLFERKADNNELVMDGIAVNSKYRGCGFGSALLEKIIQYATDNNYDTVRLDVIDSNPKAKKLYESKGFNIKKHENYPFLKYLLGFSSSSIMVFYVNKSAND